MGAGTGCSDQTGAMDLLATPYASYRFPMVGRRGAVATSQPVAAAAGLEMLTRGGNAVDAALATAIALTVVEPTSNGIGSDAFALVWDGATVHGLNASGSAPRALTRDAVIDAGYERMPELGWLPVTVPGAPSAWRALHERWGRLPFEVLFEPAIRLAEEGFAVTPYTSWVWLAAARRYARLRDAPQHAGWFSTFSPDGTGSAPRAGEVMVLPDHARTLRLLAATGCDAFYRGDLAVAIEAFAQSTGGLLSADDLAAHRPDWVDPISTTYRDHEVWEIPPNGQGITALTALNILEGTDIADHPRDSVASFHLQIESMKLAFADALRHVADPAHVAVPVAGMLDKAYAATRRGMIGATAGDPPSGDPPRGGTVYLCAADGDGMMVSYIQSNYQGFGSAIVVPGTGIALQNRGANFSLDASHPNVLAPGKRPYQTIIPGMLTRAGEVVGPFGVMGGFMQPQGHVQVVVNTVDHGLQPQAALDAPRFRWTQGRMVEVEMSTPPGTIEGLRRIGHRVIVQPERGEFGKGQIIRRLPGGALVAATDQRADGAALVC